MPSLLLKLILCLFFISCTIWYGKTHFYRDPGSIFYDEAHAFEQRYSQHRRREVDAFIRSQNTTSTLEPPLKSSPNPTLCLTYSSVRRQTTNYLETSIASVLTTLTSQERQDLHLTILIAEPDPSTHPNWNTTWLRTTTDTFTTYNTTQAKLSHLSHLQSTSNYAEKGVFDYTHALQLCHATGAPYIALFEDDILLANTWFIRTLTGLSQIPPSKTNSWLFMRLFNQERSTGWASRSIGGNNEHWIILAIGVSISLAGYLARRQSQVARSWVDWGTLGVVVLVLNPAMVVLFFQAGKASLLPPSPGVYEEGFGCCSQAMVFPRERVADIVGFLGDRGSGQVDLLLDEMAVEGGWGRWAMYPVVVQHIGLDSARKTVKAEAQAIWSMAFEDLDAAALEREHLRLVDGYYSREMVDTY
ncbi:uncharacterized protein BDW43DRAFT_316871 [Aspergillus alliaceus]|uniref:uncharacterized protein n=1 Tax=Petromyces alliaceus TaxID=209559 RepID=UPI0012A69593|nr:uncharacterized protein BDW43DRAFT_316871 [Aspergillus alliaceus]KAB8227395.1 hypothetical protein BDW43DRAFT_316871 [Aspergillus alliaceus]